MQIKTALRYAELLTGSEETSLHVRAIHDQKKQNAVKLFGSILDLQPELERLESEGYGLFVVVNAGGDTDAEINQVRACFIDGDNMPQPDSWHVPPDFLVHRDSTHWHAYWRVNDLSTDQFREVQKRLIAQYGTDKTIHNPARVMRLPGSTHQKGAPIQVTLEDRETWSPGSTREQLTAGTPEASAGETITAAAPGVTEDMPANIARGKKFLEDLVKQGKVAVEADDTGDGTTWWVAANLVRDMNLSQKTTLDLMYNIWNPHCRPPWEYEDLGVKIKNASNHGTHAAGASGVVSAAQAFGPALDKLKADPSQPIQLPRFYVYRGAELKRLPPPSWLIPDFIPAWGTIMLYAEEGSYKSFISLHAGLGLAHGKKVFDHQGDPIEVVYIAGEGPHTIAHERQPAWEIAHEVEPTQRFGLIANMPLVHDMTLVQEAIAQIKSQSMNPKLLVLDTAADAMSGLDENNVKDVRAFIEGMKEFRGAFPGVSILFDHHTNRGSKEWRGSGALSAACDARAKVIATKTTRAVAVKMEKVRDAELRPEPWTFQGRLIGPSLVFFPTTPETHRQITTVESVFERRRVGQALHDLGAIDHEHGVRDAVLVAQLLPNDPAETVEARQEAIGRGCQELGKLAKAALVAYYTTDKKGRLWHTAPSPE